MRRTVTCRHRYPVGPDRLFALVSDLDTLDAVSKPWIEFYHLPSGPVHTGQVFDVALSLFGLLPARPYRLRVTLCDRQARRLRSEEEGMGLRRLSHEMEVIEEPGGSVLIDRVEILAGWTMPLTLLLARIMLRWRHHVRLRLLA